MLQLSKQGIGNKIGLAFGGPAGGLLGTFADSMAGRIFGKGDYVQALPEGTQMPLEMPAVNSFIAPLTSQNIPSMHTDANGTVRVTRREFLRTLTIKTAEQTVQLVVAPFAFPWLKPISNGWERWTMLGCVLEYVPSSSASIAGPNAAMGTINACCVSDVGLAASSLPITKADVLSFANSVEAAPFRGWVLPIECAPEQIELPVKYTRQVSSRAPFGTFEQTQLAIAVITTVDSQSASAFVCGELWVSYDILLMGPRVAIPPPALMPVAGDADSARYCQLMRETDLIERKYKGIYHDSELHRGRDVLAALGFIQTELATPAMRKQALLYERESQKEVEEDFTDLDCQESSPDLFLTRHISRAEVVKGAGQAPGYFR